MSDAVSILRDNLATVSERLSLSREQHALCLDMLLDGLCAQYPEAPIDALYHRFLSLLPEADGASSAQFFRSLSQKRPALLALSADEMFGMNEQPMAGSHGKIAYVRNRYNERAFEQFSNMLPNAKATLVSSFLEACESVYDGTSSYCILPIENGLDGHLFRFYDIADRYELKLCAVINLEGEDENDSIRYALAGRCALRSIPKGKSCILEFSLTREDCSHLSDLLSAASVLEAVPQKLNFMPTEFDRRFYRQYFSFCVSYENAVAFGYYLSLTYPNYTPIGFYPL